VSDHHAEISELTAAHGTAHEQLETLFELGRQVTAVLDLDDLLSQIPGFIARLIRFDAFAVYLLDEHRGELRIAYPVGYPEGVAAQVRLRVGEGLVGSAVAARRPILAADLAAEGRYLGLVPDMRSAIVVPLVYKGRVIGALNILCHERGVYTEDDLALLRQFGVHVAVALENARLFERERRDAEVFETLVEIGREASSILDLDRLLRRLAHLTKRVIDYRTFGIMLMSADGAALELRHAVHYGEGAAMPRIELGEGLVGYAALHKVPVLVPDVSQDPRYIQLIDDVRSELVVPILFKDRCLGVFDLESPELDAFDSRHVETLMVLAAQAAVAIENARLYEEVRSNEERLERELMFARTVQRALLPQKPTGPPGVDVAARFEPASELGGDFYDLINPDRDLLVATVGDVSGKGAPAALYSIFAGDLFRSRTLRRRYVPERAAPAAVLASVNTVLNDLHLEGYYCSACYAVFDLERREVVVASSGLPYPIHHSAAGTRLIEVPGIPLGAFAGTEYDELHIPLAAGDVFCFFSDGIVEAMNEEDQLFSSPSLLEIVRETGDQPADALADRIVEAVRAFRSGTPPSDDLTLVVVRITS